MGCKNELLRRQKHLPVLRDFVTMIQYIYMHIHTYVHHVYIHTLRYMNVSMYECMMYECMYYECMYVCMYVQLFSRYANYSQQVISSREDK